MNWLAGFAPLETESFSDRCLHVWLWLFVFPVWMHVGSLKKGKSAYSFLCVLLLEVRILPQICFCSFHFTAQYSTSLISPFFFSLTSGPGPAFIFSSVYVTEQEAAPTEHIASSWLSSSSSLILMLSRPRSHTQVSGCFWSGGETRRACRPDDNGLSVCVCVCV